MKVELTSTEQAWFLLSALGKEATDHLRTLQPGQLESVGRLIVWVGKKASKPTIATEPGVGPRPEGGVAMGPMNEP